MANLEQIIDTLYNLSIRRAVLWCRVSEADTDDGVIRYRVSYPSLQYGIELARHDRENDIMEDPYYEIRFITPDKESISELIIPNISEMLLFVKTESIFKYIIRNETCILDAVLKELEKL